MIDRTAAAAVLLLSAFASAPVHAQAAAADNAVQWIKIDSRIITPQLLKDHFDLAGFSGRFKAFRIAADRGTIEVARVIVVYPDGTEWVDNRFSVLKPRSKAHHVDIDKHGRDVARVTIITSMARGTLGRARLTLYGHPAIDRVAPPPTE